MSVDVKHLLYEKLGIESLVEDLVIDICYHNNLEIEEYAPKIVDHILENVNVIDYVYNCFKFTFHDDDNILNYLDSMDRGSQAVDSFAFGMDRAIVKIFNNYLPEDKQLKEEIVH